MPVGDTEHMGGHVDVEQVKERAEDALEDASGGAWLERLARAGLVARGLVHAVVALSALQVARGHDPNQAVGIDGALKRLTGSAYGTLLVVVVAFGMAAYGLCYFFAEARYRRVCGR